MIQSEIINRYNDDFYLDVGLSPDKKYCHSSKNMEHINFDDDWSICFSFVGKNIPSKIMGLRDILGGWSITTTTLSNITTLHFKNPTIVTDIGVLGNVIDKITTIALNFDSTTKELDTYLNGVKVNTVVLPLFIPSTRDYGLFVLDELDISFIGGGGKFGMLQVLSFNRTLTTSEIIYIYDTLTIPSTTHDNLEIFLTFNSVARNLGDVKYSTKTASSWNGGTLLSNEMVGDGVFEVDSLTSGGDTMVGLCSLSNPVANWNYTSLGIYGFYFAGGNFRVLINGNFSVSPTIIPRDNINTVKIERVGTTMTWYVDNVQVHQVTDVATLTKTKPVVTIFTKHVMTAKNMRINGVEVYDIEDTANTVNMLYSVKDVVDLYNPLKNSKPC